MNNTQIDTSDKKERIYNTTQTDINLAIAYYPILISCAKSKSLLTYEELINKAKLTYPDNNTVQNAIAVSTGRRLGMVRKFTNERNLPDITCLVINKGHGECGGGYTSNFDPEEARETLRNYNWENVSCEFGEFMAIATKTLISRKKIKYNVATNMMSKYYYANKSSLPDWIVKYREGIIEMIMEGFTEQESFDEFIHSA